MNVFEVTKQFPGEEKYSLTSQIRRSSRAVSANIAEAYRKRQYPAHFVAKISDADMDNTETSVWLDFSLECKYLDSHLHQQLTNINIEIGKLLADLLKYPEKYSFKNGERTVN